jgi:hypothetical protein
MNTLQLWHGGRNLESNYTTFSHSSKGRWEYGPGLYLTTHYERARDYAKGGGKTYLVTLEEGNDLNHVFINIALVNEFVNQYIIKSKQTQLLEDLYTNMTRSKTAPNISANILVNLIINNEAMQNTKTVHLNKFLVDNGVDYGYVSNFGGRPETVVVVFNLQKIKRVKAIQAKDVTLELFEMPINFEYKQTNNMKL